MAIQAENIKFVKSAVMDDVPEGGGAMTGVVIIDNQMNEVFADISDQARALGDFSLRKIALAVRTESTDLYGDARVLVTELPEDPSIAYTLIASTATFDERDDVLNIVEAYLYKGPMWVGVLFENHIIGMRAINVLQRINTPLPPIGKTLCLVQYEGQGNQKEQYVRVTDVETTETIFTDAQGDYTRWLVRLDLSDALIYDFSGHSALRYETYDFTTKTRIRDTTVADAASYYSSRPLIESAEIGDMTVRADSVYTQLVPSARTETPLVSQIMNPDVYQTLSAGTRSVEVAQQAHTMALEVTAENRRLNWIETIDPLPAPGTLSISFMSQGNWYILQDNGAGVISGSDPAFGAGTINYVTGSNPVTIGALPDAGSQIMYAWASPIHYVLRSGGSAINETFVRLNFTLPTVPVLPATVVAAWEAGNAAKTASADAAGIFTGDATGIIDPVTGEGELYLTRLPDRGSTLTIDFEYYEPTDPDDDSILTETISAASPITLSAIPLDQSLRMIVPLSTENLRVLAINDAGDIKVPVQYCRDQTSGLLTAYQVKTEQTIGTIVDDEINITETLDVAGNKWMLNSTWAWSQDEIVERAVDITGDVSCTYRPDVSGAGVADQYEIAITELEFRLLPNKTDSAVPNSVRLILGGLTYNDASGDLLTGTNFDSGDIDYSTARCTLTYWTDGALVSPSVTSLLSRYGQWTAIEASFRTSIAPIVPESLGIVVTTADGEQITGTGDVNGVITGDYMRGEVNYAFGTARVEFGELIDEIWTSRAVDPSTLRYNAVGYRYIPISAEVLGVNTVRLPADGRVPIFRPGNLIQIIHPDETTGTPAQVGGVGPYLLDCGRTRLAWVRITDNNGDPVTEDFTLDRATGILSWESIAGLAVPITVRHVVADLRLVADAQLGGYITLTRALSHDFPADESIVCSCLLLGDRKARVSAAWDQVSWNGTWVDYLVGSNATATLDLVNHPIQVTNEGTETERWVLRWTTGTNVELIGETRGLVFSGLFNTDIAPVNPRTDNVPYLLIPVAANGGGWSAGNVVRINTVGAIAPFWIARSVLPSEEPLDDGADGCEIHGLGNIDRP